MGSAMVRDVITPALSKACQIGAKALTEILFLDAFQ